MSRVLFVQPSLQPPGGGNGVGAWMLQALMARHQVTLFSLVPFEAEAVNRFYGTRIDGAALTNIVALPWLTPLFQSLPTALALFKNSLLLRALPDVVHAYDLVVSANNEADLGRRGIQYVHYPTYLRPRPRADLRPYHLPLALRSYYRLCDRLARANADGVRRNLSLVNSDWTGAVMRGCYGGTTTTLFPPVAGDFPVVPWEARADGFACIGRLSPEKEFERVFAILGTVRRRFPEVRLELVVSQGKPSYARSILRLAERERAWVRVHRGLSRQALLELLSRQRYGIHAMREEHFGMAVAEMVRAGAIVWVPNGGGQVEIVKEPRLVYASDAEAVDQISATLADAPRRAELRAHLARLAGRFGEARFMADFTQLTDEFCATAAADAAPRSPSPRRTSWYR